MLRALKGSRIKRAGEMPLWFLGEGRIDGKKERKARCQQVGYVQGRFHGCPDTGRITGMKGKEGKVTPSMLLFLLGMQPAAFGPGVHETSQQGSEHHPSYCQG